MVIDGRAASAASVAAVGGLSLVLSFAVAEATGVRWAGGIVLVAGACWCVLRARRAAGLPRTITAIAAFALAFAVSHPLGDRIGAWPAVLVTALGASLTTFVLVRGARVSRDA